MRFTLRPWTMADLESLVLLANNAAIAGNMMDGFPHPYTAEAGKAFIRFATGEEPVRLFAIDVDGKAAGGIGLHPQPDIYRKNIELGYWLGEPFWGKGIITEAIQQMTAYAFSTYDINRIVARPFGSNTGSQKALEKAGFKLEGRFEKTIFKNGRYEDELIYAIRRSLD